MTRVLVFASLTFASAADFPSDSQLGEVLNLGAPLTTTACPRCNAALPAGAQFCGSCGAQIGAAPPPPPIPQAPTYAPSQMARGFSGTSGGASKQANFNGSAQDAFTQAINALNATSTSSNGAISSVVSWQQPPGAAKFETVAKSVWSTLGFAIKYDGDLSVQPSAPGQVTVRYGLKVQWGSALGLILTQGALVVFAAMVNPYVFAFAIFLIIGFMGFTAWNVASGMPEKMLQQVLKHFGGTPAGYAPQTYTPPTQPNAPPPVPPPPAAAVAPAAAASPAAAAPGGDSAVIMDQIKQLGSLRDAGVLTQEEFDAKKAELLKRI